MVAFFLEASRLCEPAYANLFEAVLKTDEAADIRKYLTSSRGTEQLIKLTLNGVPPPQPAQGAAGATATTPTAGGTTPPGNTPGWATLPPLTKTVDAAELAHRGLRLVRLLSKKEPKYLAEQKLMVSCIRALWTKSLSQSPSISAPPQPQMVINLANPAQIRQQEHQKILLTCLMSYCRAQSKDVDTLFDMLTHLHTGASVSGHPQLYP